MTLFLKGRQFPLRLWGATYEIFDMFHVLLIRPWFGYSRGTFEIAPSTRGPEIAKLFDSALSLISKFPRWETF